MNRPQQNYGSFSSSVAGISGDSSSTFNNYSDSVVTNIYTINASLKTLENALKTIGTNRDNQGLRNNMWVLVIFKILFAEIIVTEFVTKLDRYNLNNLQ